MSPKLLSIRRERARLIADSLAEETGLPVDDIIGGKGRDPEVVAARHHLWTRLVDSGLSIVSVATVIGVHHTSVIHGVKKTLGESAYRDLLRSRKGKAS